MELTPTTERGAAETRIRVHTRSPVIVIALLLAALAGIPRLIGLRDFFTTDEAYHWITRTERFAAALAAGNWADTIQTGHPGVTLMWLGSLGLQFERLALSLGLIGAVDTLTHLAWLRSGPALFHVAALLGGWFLLHRLLRPGIALLAVILWALSPYLAAHGRLLHLDALLTDLCTLSFLAILLACREPDKHAWTIASGILMGLALLTKGPALIMLPLIGLTMFALAPRPLGVRFSVWFLHGLRWSLSRYLPWLALAGLTCVLLWPALWVAPQTAISRYLGEIFSNGGRPNGDGQFFLGRADADPGPLFYLIAGLFRLTPLELLGLIVAPFALRRLRRPEAHTLLALLALIGFWTLVMTLGPKKFDRYTLPAWPALLVWSAVGWAFVVEWVQSRVRRPGIFGITTSVVVLFQGITLAWYHPYYLSYYNPLLGGGPVAQRSFLIGWGEGMDQVGAWLSARPDIGEGQVLSALPPTLQPFVPVPVQSVRMLGQVPANYAVVYLESIQRADQPEVYAQIRETVPLHTVTIHGIEYAWIHQLPKPFDVGLDAQFGAGLHLRGYSFSLEERRLIITPSWDVRARIEADLFAFVYVYDANGNRVAQIDVPPGGASTPPTGTWEPGAQIAVPLPIDLPADLPAGRYQLVLGLYDPTDFTRLPLNNGPAADPALAGNDAVLLGEVVID